MFVKFDPKFEVPSTETLANVTAWYNDDYFFLRNYCTIVVWTHSRDNIADFDVYYLKIPLDVPLKKWMENNNYDTDDVYVARNDEGKAALEYFDASLTLMF